MNDDYQEEDELKTPEGWDVEKCCKKCHDIYFEKTWPAHTAHNACIDPWCECHLTPPNSIG